MAPIVTRTNAKPFGASGRPMKLTGTFCDGVVFVILLSLWLKLRPATKGGHLKPADLPVPVR